MNWTNERTELLRKLWAEGLSCSQIADQLGYVSRNAVIGKVHRLKLPGRDRLAATRKKSQKSRVEKPKIVKLVFKAATRKSSVPPQTPLLAAPLAEEIQEFIKPAHDVVTPISRRLQLIQLNERSCKWPNGDPLTEEFHFCGNEAAEFGPYCSYHARIAFQPASERRRRL